MSGTRIHRVSLEEGEVTVELRGSGPAVLFVHGISAHRGSWDAVLRRLEAGRTLVLPDLLGRGESAAADRARYRLADESRRLLLLLADLDAACGIRPATLVGHSQGAALALTVARRAAEVGGLVLVAPVTPWTRRPAALSLLRPRLMQRVGGAILRAFRRPLGRWVLGRVRHRVPPTAQDVRGYTEPYADPGRSRSLLRALADWDPRELVPRPPEACAVRLLAGAADHRVRPVDVRRLAARLGCAFEVLPGVGHDVPAEAPDAVAAAVRAVGAESAAPADRRSTHGDAP